MDRLFPLASLVMMSTLTAVVGVPVGAALAEHPTEDIRATSDEGRLADDHRSSARSIRTTYGLASSDAAIDAAQIAPDDVTSEFLGIRVTNEELARIQRQLNAEKAVDANTDAVSRALGPEFGGVWVDRARDGVKVATTGDQSKAYGIVEEHMPGTAIDVVEVDRSLDDLRRIAHEIADSAEPTNDAFGVVGIGREPMDNRVVVSIDARSDLDAARERLNTQYGAAVRVEHASIELLNRTSGAPWKAGKQIKGPHYSSGTVCTGAYGVQQHGVNYVTTAGHCVFSAVLPSANWRVGTHNLGTMIDAHSVPYKSGSFADAALIQVGSSWAGSPQHNCVYTTSTSCSTVLSYSDPSVGGSVCYSGAVTGYLDQAGGVYCGIVSIEREWANDVGFTYYYDMLEVPGFSETPCHGDSGSPIFSPFLSTSFGVIGRGILSYRTQAGPCGSSSVNMGFSKWSNVQKELHIEGGCGGQWGASVGCSSTTYSDVGRMYPFHKEIEWATDEDIATGYSDGTFRPSTAVSRQAAVTFLWRKAGEPSTTYNPGFTDVGSSHPFYDAIRWAWGTGRVTGYSSGCPAGAPCFKGNDSVSRQAWAAFLYREAGSPYAGMPASEVPDPLGHLCDVSTSHPFYAEIMWNVNEWVTRVGDFAAPNPTCWQSFVTGAAANREITASGLYELEN